MVKSKHWRENRLRMQREKRNAWRRRKPTRSVGIKIKVTASNVA